MQRTPVRSVEENRYRLKMQRGKKVMKKKKLFSLVLVVMLLCGVMMPYAATEASAASATLVYEGRIECPEVPLA